MDDNSEQRSVCVYKVGGSLFDWPELFDRLGAVLDREQRRPLLVSGGGAAADVVREWDRIHQLGERRAHRLAMQAMELGAAFLATGLNRIVPVTGRCAAKAAWAEGRWPVLNAGAFLESDEFQTVAGSAMLPASWDVTSDSIAAAIAVRWPADLVLLKSTSPAAAREPFVDRHFPIVRGPLQRAEWFNLRTGQQGAL